MDNDKKKKLSKKYYEGLYGLWRPKKKLPPWRCYLFLFPINIWYPSLVWFPRRSYYLFGSFELKDPGIKTPYEMSEGERDFYLRRKAFERACKVSRIYHCKPWEELCTPKVFLREVRGQWDFIWSKNASPYIRMCYFFHLLIFASFYLVILTFHLVILFLAFYILIAI